MSAEIDIVVDAGEWSRLGDPDTLANAAADAVFAVLPGRGADAVGFSVLFTDDEAVRELNQVWRGKDTATNVLSFPVPRGSAPDAGPRQIGDIALAWETVAREADEEAKRLPDHATHLIIHGILHLLGYDHESNHEAEEMEALEAAALARLGIADPHRDEAA